jgi:hypothetical protein
LLDRIISEQKSEDILNKLKPKPIAEYPLPKRIPSCLDYAESGLSKRREHLKKQGISSKAISGELPDYNPSFWDYFLSMPATI